MIVLCSWALVIVGCVIIVTQSHLFRPLRELAERRLPPLGVLLRCPLCFGWWAGAGLSLVGLVSPSSFACPTWPLLARCWADGCAASAACWCVHVVLVRLGANDL